MAHNKDLIKEILNKILEDQKNINRMYKKYERSTQGVFYFIIILLLLSNLLYLITYRNKSVDNFRQSFQTEQIRWVKGKYGKHCYPEDNYHGNIKIPIYFDNLNLCLKSLQKDIKPIQE